MCRHISLRKTCRPHADSFFLNLSWWRIDYSNNLECLHMHSKSLIGVNVAGTPNLQSRYALRTTQFTVCWSCCILLCYTNLAAIASFQEPQENDQQWSCILCFLPLTQPSSWSWKAIFKMLSSSHCNVSAEITLRLDFMQWYFEADVISHNGVAPLQWQDAYPDAKLYACPGLQEKTDVKYDRELSSTETSPPEWLGEVECACLSYERNPFTGSQFFNEVRLLMAKELVS